MIRALFEPSTGEARGLSPVQVSLQFLQIYLERVYDLLPPGSGSAQTSPQSSQPGGRGRAQGQASTGSSQGQTSLRLREHKEQGVQVKAQVWWRPGGREVEVES